MNINNQLFDLAYRYLGIRADKFKYVGGGSFGKVYKYFDESSKITYVFKLYLVDNLAQKEAASLNALAKNTAVKFPKVYFLHIGDDEIPFDCLCMEYINGKNALFNVPLLLSSKKTKAAFAEQVVDGLLDIHSIKSPNGRFGDVENPQYDSWLAYYKPFAKDIYEKAVNANAAGKFDGYILHIMKPAWAKFDEIFSTDVFEPCLIHGDINVMNIMVDKMHSVSAFIDPFNSMYADREYDIFQLQNLTGNCFGLYDLYKKKHKVSEKCDIKCAFYGLWNEAMVYLRTGTYTGYIMKAAIKRMKKELNPVK